MFNFLRRFFIENLGLKVIALVLALITWFYIVKQLNMEGTQEEMQLLKRIMPSERIIARKLPIKPIFIGHPRSGYEIVRDKALMVPEHCIVLGTKDVLENIKFAYTVPIDVGGMTQPFTKSVPLSPISGVYLEETLVQVMVSIEKETQ
ncbi:MAG: YbbR-like domain-containing protein [Candidatus Omnitrophota bacterium]|jgi:YbbR domain-containing protein